MSDDDLEDTLPGGTRCIPIPPNKLRVEVKTTTLFFTVESKICLFAGKNLIAESKCFDTPPKNAIINLFVRSQIVKHKSRLGKLGINIIREIKNFGG